MPYSAREIIDYAEQDDAAKMREALYAAIYDKVHQHIEDKKQEISRSLVGQGEEEVETPTDAQEVETEEEPELAEEGFELTCEDFMALDDDQKQEVWNQLDELSKNTLKSYVKKASTQAADKSYVSGYKDSAMTHVGGSKKAELDRQSNKADAKAAKRLSGISTAADKLSK